MEVIRSKIEFTYEPIKDIFEEISNIVYSNTENIFLETIKLMNDNEITESWNIAVENDVNLNEEDKSTIKNSPCVMGYFSSRISQKTRIFCGGTHDF